MDSIDISSIRVWKLTLIPFGENDRKGNHVWELQKKCADAGIAPLGFWVGKYWDVLKGKILAANLNYANRTLLNDDSKKRYLEIYKDARNYENDNDTYNPYQDKSLKNSLKNMESIKENDYIIMRLRDGKYYIGKAKGKALFVGGNPQIGNSRNNISWGVEIKGKFKILTEEEIPSEISGRFSQRNQRTLTPINNIRIRILVEKLYNQNVKDIPNIKLTINNFASSLNYMELEDLVALYIQSKIMPKDEYFLLPSSGKINREKYEFSFFSRIEGKKPITCQVKNKEYIDPLNYKDDVSNYEAIYLFSGQWRKSDYDNFSIYKNSIIKPIPREELYDLLEEYFAISGKNIKNYYTISERSNRFNLKGYFKKFNKIGNYSIQKKERRASWNTKYCIRYGVWKTSGEKDNKFDSEYYVSVGFRDVYYCPDFNLLVIDIEETQNNSELLKSIKDYFKGINWGE